jgi:hypothetical protein
LSVSTSSRTSDSSARHDGATATVAGTVAQRRTTETKAAFKTTEFVVYVLAVVGVLLASYLVGDADGRGDVFLADQAWFYVTLLSIGYLISRGLAKAGSRERYDA